MQPTSVLFVCLGNICRSPMAEGVFRRMVAGAGLESVIRIDSAGTGDWHVGEPPDRRAIAAAARREINIAGLRARQATGEDLMRFDHVLAMDRDNLAALQRLAAPGSAAPRLFLGHAARTGVDEVPDPYLHGGFDAVLDLIEAGASELLRSLREHAAGAQ
jgi:protein-tyrosine phosphatase